MQTPITVQDPQGIPGDSETQLELLLYPLKQKQNHSTI